MAFTPAGGREYYTGMQALTSGTTNCNGTGAKSKGIMSGASTTDLTMYFGDSAVRLTPAENTIIPFSPDGVTFGSGTVYKLF